MVLYPTESRLGRERSKVFFKTHLCQNNATCLTAPQDPVIVCSVFSELSHLIVLVVSASVIKGSLYRARLSLQVQTSVCDAV